MSMPVLYSRRVVKTSEKKVGIYLCGAGADENLVAVVNLLVLRHSESCGYGNTYQEEELTGYLRALFSSACGCLQGIPSDELESMRNLIDKFRTGFSLQPFLGGHREFQHNTSVTLLNTLLLEVFHCWVIDPKSDIYENVKELSCDQFVTYCNNVEEQGDNREVCDSLLLDLQCQLTPYGLSNLRKEARLHGIGEGGLALLYWRSKLHVMVAHHDDVLVLVTDEHICNQMKDACWMLLEEDKEENIYFTDGFEPTEGQPFLEKAKEKAKVWKKKVKLAAKYKKQKDKKKEKQLCQQGPEQPAQQDQVHAQQGPVLPAQQGQMHAQQGPVLPAQQVQVHAQQSPVLPAQQGPAEQSPVLPAQQGPASAQQGPGVPPQQGQGQAVAQHVQVAAQQGSGQADQQGKSDDVADEPGNKEVKSSEVLKSEDGQHVVSAGVPKHKRVYDVPKGAPEDFLKFLLTFKERESLEPYFKGIAAAFSSHRPMFYVPYDFIMAHDEKLALNIQDNFESISKDLEKSITWYLYLNKVNSPDDAKLRIIGLPLPKSVQMFLDYFGSIVPHVHYDVYGEDPQASLSPDSRRMGLGYLDCIVAKFRTRRCFRGQWSEENMKVKDRSKFYIDCKEDYELTPEGAYYDLWKFGSTVLERLKYKGKHTPYIAQFEADIELKVIEECWADDVKWERFLQLVSYPLGLKPPLVRASFFCEIYMAAKANSSGEVPRYSPLNTRRDCVEWRLDAMLHPLLCKVYLHQNLRKARIYGEINDHWSETHWHVFKYSRHFTQHVLDHTKGDDSMQKVKDIGVVDLLLFRRIWKSIGASVRFLVLNIGVDGIFSAAWRHYIGSDYIDNPSGNADNATTDDTVKDLVDNISGPVKSGRVLSELSVYSEPQHELVIFTEADLIQLEAELRRNGFEVDHSEDGCLCCQSVCMRKFHVPATEDSPEYSALVVEGPYSHIYEAICHLVAASVGL